MKWSTWRHFPWIDTRMRFISAIGRGGTLIDLGSSDGETLSHIEELRPDLRLYALDIAGAPDSYPLGCKYIAADLNYDSIPLGDNSVDAITCMQLIEHLDDPRLLLQECARILKPGGRLFFETPHPKTLTLSSPRGSAAGTFTINFFDDPTHKQVVPVGRLAALLTYTSLKVEKTGVSRNWLFAMSYPLLAISPASRRKHTAMVHWLGWSAFLIARKHPISCVAS